VGAAVGAGAVAIRTPINAEPMPKTSSVAIR
jgi:hypothetical protein